MQYVRTETMNMQELVSGWSNQSPEQLVAKASQHLPPWVSLALVVLIAYYLARIVWLLYPAGDAALWTPPQVTGNRVEQNAGVSASAYDNIVQAHLFGTASLDNSAPAVVETEDAPDTRLNLKLRAAVAASDKDAAHAIIADGSGNEKVYFVGGSIPGGASLHRVHPDRVILNRGGVLESLRLPREFDGQGVSTSTRRTSSPGRSTSVQQMINNNAASFVEIIRPQPFMPNGKMKGYRVFPGRNRQQFIALGLRPGDLVTAVNGVALDDPSRGMEIFKTLGDASQVDVTVERGGQRQDLSLNIADLANATGNKR